MFNKLFDFSYVRTSIQAIGFYIAYFLIIVVLAMVIGGIYGALSTSSENSFNIGIKIGAYVAIINVIILSFLILNSKKLFTPLNLILALVSVGLAYFGGALLGLIIVAYFTTLGQKPAVSTTPPAQPPAPPTPPTT